MYSIFGDSGFDISFVAVLVFFSLGWVLSVIIKNVSIVDIMWGTGYAIQVFTFYFTHEYNVYSLIVLILVSFHGLRLTIHIAIRNIGHGEDWRYQNFRAKYGGEKHYWWVSFFQVFLLQAVINLGICSSFGLFMMVQGKDILNDWNSAGPNQVIEVVFIIGAILTNIGTWVEAISDLQLYLFKQDPSNKGKLLTTGLWSLCKHPNYFGETLFWWGTYLFSCSVGQYWAIYSPVIITLLIVFVSGVYMLEDPKRVEKYGEEYREYLTKTAKFIPFIW